MPLASKSWLNEKEPTAGSSAGSVTFLMVTLASLVLVKVQVMSWPEPSSTDTPLAPELEKSAGSLVPVMTQLRPVRAQPVSPVSVMT